MKIIAALALLTVIGQFCQNAGAQVDSGVLFVELEQLPYSFDATLPVIDELTNIVHYNRSLRTVVSNLNNALATCSGLYSLTNVEGLLDLVGTPTLQANCTTPLRNLAGSYINHVLYFATIGPLTNMSFAEGASPELQQAIADNFGSFENFTTLFSAAANGVFGSGWAYLCVEEDRSLNITTTPNQDNPRMTNIVANPCTPFMAIDVWEHAYFLTHLNVRANYVSAFYDIVNWNAVSMMYADAVAGQMSTIEKMYTYMVESQDLQMAG